MQVKRHTNTSKNDDYQKNQKMS